MNVAPTALVSWASAHGWEAHSRSVCCSHCVVDSKTVVDTLQREIAGFSDVPLVLDSLRSKWMPPHKVTRDQVAEWLRHFVFTPTGGHPRRGPDDVAYIPTCKRDGACGGYRDFTPYVGRGGEVLCESLPERAFASAWARVNPHIFLVAQHPVLWYRLDFYAPHWASGIEIDGAAHHSGATEKSRDAERQHRIESEGIRIHRVSAAAVLRDARLAAAAAASAVTAKK